MCLAVPGKVLKVERNEAGVLYGEVSFGGIHRQVCLACTPEARVGDYVLVHVGFAIGRVDEEEAAAILDLIRRLAPPGDEAPPGEVSR
jgi:hydrogenase expression/formation protein HypC